MTTAAPTKVHTIPVSRIHAGTNDRTTFDPHDLQDLALSISKHGLAQPITVRPDGDGYEIVAGERRFRAMSTILEWTEVPALVREMDDRAAADIMLVENIQRTDLNPMDEANAYASRVARFGMGVPEIAATATVSESRVRSRLRLTQLVPEAQHLVSTGNLGLGFADAMTDLDVNRQRIALRSLNDCSKPTVQWFRRLCGELLAAQAQSSMFDTTLFMQQTEAELSASVALPAIPVDESLPEVAGGGTVSEVLAKYMAMLLGSEDPTHRAAALVVGKVWDGLIRCNCARPRALPVQPERL